MISLNVGGTRFTTSIGVANHKKFRGPPKVGRSPKLGDVSKGAACSKMATAKLGWVGDIDWAIAPNFRRSSKLLVVCHPGGYREKNMETIYWTCGGVAKAVIILPVHTSE